MEKEFSIHTGKSLWLVIIIVIWGNGKWHFQYHIAKISLSLQLK